MPRLIHLSAVRELGRVMNMNPKVLSFDPLAFAPYAGFTYLFNNPDADRRPARGGMELLSTDLADPRNVLYDALRQLVSGVFTSERMSRFTFCPLAPPTYHVTACDGMTVSAMERIGDNRRLDIARQLWRDCRGGGDADLLRQLAPHFKLQPPQSGVRFRFSRISVIERDGAALIAMLQPADAGSSRFFELLRAERHRISAAFGLPPSSGPDAHVSLGYFFDNDRASLFEGEIPQLGVEGLCAAEAITFHSISLYWFDDMQTFWRAT